MPYVAELINHIRGRIYESAYLEGRQILNNAVGTFDLKALAVLTDGVENRSRTIADVASQINEKTYAVGLGTPQNTSAAALQTISGNNGGFLLVTGAIGTDNRFLLQKYFLQILAGISNAEVVLDPDGALAPGAVHRIPFQLTEADAGVDVILLSPYVKAVDFRLQTPSGLILEPWRALSEPAMRFSLGNGVSLYRLVLPTQLVADRFDQGGTWHALLTIGRPRLTRNNEHEQGIDPGIARGLHASPAQRLRSLQRQSVMTEQQRSFAVAQSAAVGVSNFNAAAAGAAAPNAASSSGGRRTLPYSLIVHSYSNVALRAELHQSGYEPGARIDVLASLTQSGVPLQGQGTVWAEWTRPDGSTGELNFTSTEPGRYSAQFIAASAGVHKLRVRARGRSRKGLPFTREQTLTAVVWRGGDSPTGGGRDPLIDLLNERDERLCELLKCLLRRGGAIEPELEKQLRAAGLDLDHIRKCLEGHCAHGAGRNPAQDG